VWAFCALTAAFTLSLTQVGATLGVEPLAAGELGITAAVAAIGVAVAAAARFALPSVRGL
jgi:hypothetical protein